MTASVVVGKGEVEAVAAPEPFDDAFRGLFLRAMHLAYKILRDRDAAEDVAAETMARAYAHWERIGALPYRDGWVLRVAGRLALKAARRHAPAHVDAVTATFEDAAAMRVAVAQALEELSRRQRDVVMLRYLSGLGEGAVATALGISIGSVKTHARRGLAALRARLGESIEEPSNANA